MRQHHTSGRVAGGLGLWLLTAGAYGCTISGAGPTCVAVTDGKEQGERIAEAMVHAFRESGPLEVNSARVVRLDQIGAKSL